MGKHIPDAVLDQVLDAIAASTEQSVSSDVSTPVDLTNVLADASMLASDFTKAVGDAGEGSRKLTMTAKPGQLVDVFGTPNYVILSWAGTIKLITTCSGPDLTVGSTVDFPQWKYEIGVPQ